MKKMAKHIRAPALAEQISLARGTCLECEHFRYLKPAIFVKHSGKNFRRSLGVETQQKELSPFMQQATLPERAMMRTLSEQMKKN